jgi:hypothetical protein
MEAGKELLFSLASEAVRGVLVDLSLEVVRDESGPTIPAVQTLEMDGLPLGASTSSSLLLVLVLVVRNRIVTSLRRGRTKVG